MLELGPLCANSKGHPGSRSGGWVRGSRASPLAASDLGALGSSATPSRHHDYRLRRPWG